MQGHQTLHGPRVTGLLVLSAAFEERWWREGPIILVQGGTKSPPMHPSVLPLRPTPSFTPLNSNSCLTFSIFPALLCSLCFPSCLPELLEVSLSLPLSHVALLLTWAPSTPLTPFVINGLSVLSRRWQFSKLNLATDRPWGQVQAK